MHYQVGNVSIGEKVNNASMTWVIMYLHEIGPIILLSMWELKIRGEVHFSSGFVGRRMHFWWLCNKKVVFLEEKRQKLYVLREFNDIFLKKLRL